MPHLHEVADEMCVIKSMNTDQFNHAPAELLLITGSARPGRPSMGSWVTYGLGSENENLPGFVVLISSGAQPNGGKNSFGSGFLPSVYQGVQCRSKGDPVLYASDPAGMDREMRRHTLDALRDLNETAGPRTGPSRDAHPHRPVRAGLPHADRRARGDGHLARVEGRRSRPTAPSPGGASFANNCLLARRLVEQGVRFVQLFDWGWDFHGTGAGRTSRTA